MKVLTSASVVDARRMRIILALDFILRAVGARAGLNAITPSA